MNSINFTPTIRLLSLLGLIAAFRDGRAVCLESEGSYVRMGALPAAPDITIGVMVSVLGFVYFGCP